MKILLAILLAFVVFLLYSIYHINKEIIQLQELQTEIIMVNGKLIKIIEIQQKYIDTLMVEAAIDNQLSVLP